MNKKEYIEKLEKQLKQKSDILNNFEKWVKSRHKDTWYEKLGYNAIEIHNTKLYTKEVLDKLNELKGDNNE